MKTSHCDNLQTWSGTWWAGLFSPPPRRGRTRHSSSQGETLIRNFVGLASEAMRWGSEAWWGENTFFFSFKGIIWLRWPCSKAQIELFASRGGKGPVFTVAGVWRHRKRKKKKENSLGNQKWFHLSGKFNAPATVWLRLKRLAGFYLRYWSQSDL